ncbi:protein FAM222A-like [Scleropages formosus]|uniref:Family with sequence similarity 222 member A n=1 Tax=Scleropages formosus TaxID=113540 RepID=A0A8C9SRM8_SCLFO|nr:protein FAM222A-like [Scleropages formosus]
MLACLQRRQNPAEQRLPCIGRTLEAPPPTTRKFAGDPAALAHSRRYPSPAELDAYAQKTSDSPLSIKIFPTNVRVPQHKHLSRTVNGFDTSGLRYGPYPLLHSGGYRGLLAIAKTPPTPTPKGVVKSAEGKRTKVSQAHITVAPYPLPGNALAHRQRQAGYPTALPKPPEAPGATATASVVPVVGSRGLALPTQANLPSIQSLIYQINQHCQPQPPSQVPEQAGAGALTGAAAGANASPSTQLTAVAAVACPSTPAGGFAAGEVPQDCLIYTGAMLPTQGAEMTKAGPYVDNVDYLLWQHKQQQQQQQQQQQHHHHHHHHHHHQQQQQQQVALRMYSTGSGGGGALSRSPETCIPGGGCQVSGRPYPLGGGGAERFSSSPLNCTAMHGNFSVGQYFAPPWNSVLATPDSDCYNPQDLQGTGPGGPQEQGPPPHGPAACGGGLCCTLPAKSLCSGAALSSSLQSLEFLISGIRPPCIKEQMLGKGYEAVGVPRLLDHQHAHIRLPVYR